MSKIWKIVIYEYKHHVFRKRFLFALLSVPLSAAAIVAVMALVVYFSIKHTPVGYVDLAGVLAPPAEPKPAKITLFLSLPVLEFDSEDEARAALEAEKIQAYYVLQEDYMYERNLRLVYKDRIGSQVGSTFRSFLRDKLLSNQPEEVAERVQYGPTFVIRAMQENREVISNEWFKMIAPFIAGLSLILVVFSTGGYLMQTVVDEKQNRTMEILITSVSPEQLIGGKVIALIGVGLTEIFGWLLFPMAIVIIVIFAVPSLLMAIDWVMVGLILLLITPTFIMLAAIMAAVGATVIEASEGQQAIGFITMPVMLPYMLMLVLIMNPGSPVAIFLSLFPLTSALTLLIRMGFSTVPAWQTASGIAILMVCAAGTLWLAGRIFRLGMLRYGQPLGLKEIFNLTKPLLRRQKPLLRR